MTSAVLVSDDHRVVTVHRADHMALGVGDHTPGKVEDELRRSQQVAVHEQNLPRYSMPDAGGRSQHR